MLKLGLQTQDGMVEVLDGIRAGERLVVRGAEALSDGAAIRIVQTGSQSAAKPDSAGAHS